MYVPSYITNFQAIIGIHVFLLIFDRFPFFITAFSIFAHIVYSTNLRKFPFISLTSSSFIASCGNFNSIPLILVFVLLDHFLFFRYFSSFPPPRSHVYDRFSTDPLASRSDPAPSFGQVAAFFGICVWLVPFGLFVSLSAGELVLPTIGSDGRISPGDDAPTKRAQGLVKQTYAAVGNWITDTMQVLGWTRGDGYIGGYSRYR
jgi:hypothetical protein